MTEAELAEIDGCLADPWWRLNNLYVCRKEGVGTAIPFEPRPEQVAIFKHLLEDPLSPIYIIKSRRLGLSTGINIFQSDSAVFRSGWRGLLIDKNQGDATKKMVEQIRFAVDGLPPEVLERVVFDKRNDSELRLRIGDETESEDSVIFATISGRGGDASMLHVSEWGPIAAEDAKRSREIRTGAFPAARLGRRVVETTWMGGKGGDLWEMIDPILKQNPNAEGTIYFFPWHDDPEAVRVDGEVDGETEEYFRELADRLGKKFSREQKLWWAATKIEQGIFMSREYPSTLEEAFRAPVEGAVYADLIDRARAEGRVMDFPWERGSLVYTFWDLGSPTNTRVLYLQFVGREIHVIDRDGGQNFTPAQRVAHMRGKGYFYGGHFMPHDAAAAEKGGKNFKEQMTEAGLEGIQVIPRCRTEWPGINKGRELLSRAVIHATNCEEWIQAMEYYHTKKDNSDGYQTNILVDDWSAHDADTWRMVGEAQMNGMLKDMGDIAKELRRPTGRPRAKARGGRYGR